MGLGPGLPAAVAAGEVEGRPGGAKQARTRQTRGSGGRGAAAARLLPLLPASSRGAGAATSCGGGVRGGGVRGGGVRGGGRDAAAGVAGQENGGRYPGEADR